MHTLQMAAQGALDVASHLVSDEGLGEPVTNRQPFELLGNAGWLAPDLTSAMRNLAGFRNIVVHGYEVVGLRIVRDVTENRLQELLEFAEAVRAGLQRK